MKKKATDTGANERMHTVSETNKKKTYGRELPGGPVVRT